MSKQFYKVGKRYDWTKESWEAVKSSPFLIKGVALKQVYSLKQHTGSVTSFHINTMDVFWEWTDDEEYWWFVVEEEGVEIPEELIPFYGENVMEEKKEITDSSIINMISHLNKYAADIDSYSLGLPVYNQHIDEMIQIVKECLGVETELDKRIRDIQAVDSAITKEQAKKLIEAGVVK